MAVSRQIRAEVDRMVRIVDDLVELSRIHAGVARHHPFSVERRSPAASPQVRGSVSVGLTGFEPATP